MKELKDSRKPESIESDPIDFDFIVSKFLITFTILLSGCIGIYGGDVVFLSNADRFILNAISVGIKGPKSHDRHLTTVEIDNELIARQIMSGIRDKNWTYSDLKVAIIISNGKCIEGNEAKILICSNSNKFEYRYLDDITTYYLDLKYYIKIVGDEIENITVQTTSFKKISEQKSNSII